MARHAERPGTRGVVAVALTALGALAVGWWAWPQTESAPVPLFPPIASAAPAPSSTPTSAPSTSMAGAASTPAALPDCPHQALDIATADGPRRGCVSATHTRQSGSVRSFLVTPEGVSTWSLAVDAIGPHVLSVRLQQAPVGREPDKVYVCDGAACAGAAFGEPDAHGVRRLTLFETTLQALPAGKRWQRPRPGSVSGTASAVVAVASARVRLTADLTVEAEHIDTASECPDGGVQMVGSAGAVIRFCPMGGSGFDVAEDRQVRFTFRDLEGRQLVVALAQDRTTVASVSFGDLSCRSPMCGGVTVRAEGDAADPSVARHFMFSGLTVSATDAGKRSATLNGNVALVAQ